MSIDSSLGAGNEEDRTVWGVGVAVVVYSLLQRPVLPGPVKGPVLHVKGAYSMDPFLPIPSLKILTRGLRVLIL